MLQRYSWPGNVRELRNLIERLVIMVPGDDDHARPIWRSSTAIRDAASRRRRRAGRCCRCTRRATGSSATTSFARWRSSSGNMSRTAEVLGVERSNLYRKMRAFGIAPGKRAEEESLTSGRRSVAASSEPILQHLRA